MYLAIHYGADDWPDANTQWLGDEEIVAVSSPEIKQRFHLGDIARISTAPLLHLETRPLAWSEWFSLANLPTRQAMRGRHFDQFSMVITAATASLGVALIPSYLVEEELSSGALEQLSQVTLKTSNAYFLASPAGSSNSIVELFATWIRQEVKKSRAARESKYLHLITPGPD